LPSDFQLFQATEMGAWVFESWLERLFSGGRSSPSGRGLDLARHLRGDLFSVQDVPGSRTTVTAWRLRFDSAESAARVGDALATSFFSPKLRLVERDLILLAATDDRALSLLTSGLAFKAVPPASDTTPAMPSPRPGCPRPRLIAPP
jgi:hypothetical protein